MAMVWQWYGYHMAIPRELERRLNVQTMKQPGLESSSRAFGTRGTRRNRAGSCQRSGIIAFNPRTPLPRNVPADLGLRHLALAPGCSTSRLRRELRVGGLSTRNHGLLLTSSAL